MLPIEVVRSRLARQVGVFDPSRRRSFELYKAASWYRPLRRGPLSARPFPDTLSDAQGQITKPVGWRDSTERAGRIEPPGPLQDSSPVTLTRQSSPTASSVSTAAG